jgi:hypothetical protein
MGRRLAREPAPDPTEQEERLYLCEDALSSAQALLQDVARRMLTVALAGEASLGVRQEMQAKLRDAAERLDRVPLKGVPLDPRCAACKRRVKSPCNDIAGYRENGPWDMQCPAVLFGEDD